GVPKPTHGRGVEWSFFRMNSGADQASPNGPSTLYRRGFWRLGLNAARSLPPPICMAATRGLATLYSRLVPARRQIVLQNLLPAVHDDRHKANALTRSLFCQFGTKLVDLWRFEGGHSPNGLLIEESGWENLMSARASGRGILI